MSLFFQYLSSTDSIKPSLLFSVFGCCIFRRMPFHIICKSRSFIRGKMKVMLGRLITNLILFRHLWWYAVCHAVESYDW